MQHVCFKHKAILLWGLLYLTLSCTAIWDISRYKQIFKTISHELLSNKSYKLPLTQFNMQTNLKNQLPTNDSLILFEMLSIRNKCNQKQAKQDWTSVKFPWISNWMQKIKINKHLSEILATCYCCAFLTCAHIPN